MVPRTTKGRGFKGAAAYYLHDKGADTADRVAYTECGNIPTLDPEKAIRWMCYTAMHADDLKAEAGIKKTGRKLENPVYGFSLSWHPEERPDFEHMADAAKSALAALKLDEHQYVLVAHNDTDHRHIHALVNRVHPETGKAATLSKDHLVLSKWAEAYEREHGIHCERRIENNERRLTEGFVKDAFSQARDTPENLDTLRKQKNESLEHFDARKQAQAERAAQKKRDAEIARDNAITDRELYRAPEFEFPDQVIRQEVARQAAAPSPTEKQPHREAPADLAQHARERAEHHYIGDIRDNRAAAQTTRHAREAKALAADGPGRSLDDMRASLTDLERQLNAGGVKGLVDAALGNRAQMEAERGALVKSIADAEAKRGLAASQLQAQQQAERDAVAERTAREQQELASRHAEQARRSALDPSARQVEDRERREADARARHERQKQEEQARGATEQRAQVRREQDTAVRAKSWEERQQQAREHTAAFEAQKAADRTAQEKAKEEAAAQQVKTDWDAISKAWEDHGKAVERDETGQEQGKGLGLDLGRGLGIIAAFTLAVGLILGRPVEAAPVAAVRTETTDRTGDQSKQGGKTVDRFIFRRPVAVEANGPTLSRAAF